MSKNYYEILGVNKNASKEDIKKAFRKLAHEHHPDKKGGNAEKFKEANEAYSVLSDDQKRAQYDTYGQTFAGGAGPQGGGFGGFEGFDFSGFAGGQGGFSAEGFDLGDIFGEFFGGGSRGQAKRGRDVSVDIELSFEESIFGVERSFLIHKVSNCETCSGSGAKKGTEKIECKTCNGKGKIREMKRSIFGSIEMTRNCETCSGEGKVPKEKCDKCSGAGVLKREEEVKINIPAGIENGEMMRLSGRGEAVKGGTSGDLYIKIHVKQHKTFRKQGNDLVMNLSILLSDALLGATYDIQTLDGVTKLSIPEGINTGEILQIKNKGVPTGNKGRGDILVHIKVAMPKKLSKTAKEAIQKLKSEGL